MASRSQMRLAQITGSLSSAENAAAAINEDSLQGVMDHLASAIKRITGASNYHAQAAGHFTQDLNIDGDIDVRDNAHVSGTLHSDGQATFASANVEDLTDTHVLFAGASGELSGDANLVWDGSHLEAASVKVADLTENRIVLAGASGDLDDDAAFTMDGSIFTANMLVDFGSTGGSNGAADFDVAGYAQFAGVVEVDGALQADSTLTVASDATFNSNAIVASGGEFRGDLQYSASAGTGITMGDYYNQQHVQVAVDASWLRGTGISVADTNSMDLAMSAGGEITADLILKSANALEVDSSGLDLKASIAGSRTFEDDVTVTGNFTVNGTTTYVNTTDLIVTDAKIVISSGSLVDGAGIYLGDESAGENIRWNAADTKWIASDKLAADTLQALDLSDAIVWADASGNLEEITAANFASYLTAGAGIDSIADGQIDATPYVAGTGVTITNFTASIGQPVATSDAVEFAGITDSSLTALRLVGTNGSKELISTGIDAYIAGTANQIIVTDDGDGSITLSAPQDLDLGADVEFGTLKLADHSADAGKAYKVGVSGSVEPAAWNEFVSIEASVGLELIQDSFKAQIGLAQDIRTSASPEFTALNIGSDGDLQIVSGMFAISSANSADLYLVSDADFIIEDGYKSASTFGPDLTLASAASDWNDYKAAVGEVSLLAGIAAAAEGSLNAGKWYYEISAQVTVGSAVALSGMTNFESGGRAADVAYSNLSDGNKSADVYVNGQLMMAGAAKDYEVNGSQEFLFKFDLEADDVIQLVIR